jgi:phage anti-repressor protein
MNVNSGSPIESLIKNYIDQKEKSFHFGKKRIDAEKEYNRLLAKYSGEARNYTLDHADKIYTAYLEMVVNTEEAKKAQANFLEAEQKLNEIGEILFEASINAEISMPPVNGDVPAVRPVTVSYNNGQVIVS